MKLILCSLTAICVLSGVSCASKQASVNRQAANSSPSATSPLPPSKVSLEEAVAIAKADFERVRGTLNDFVIDKAEQRDGWRIVIRLKKEYLVGMGAVYIIDKQTGRISSREFYQ